MKFSRRIKKVSIVSSLVSMVLIMITIGIFTFNISYKRFNSEMEVLREEYYNDQKELMKNEIYEVYDYIQFEKSKIEDKLRREIKHRVYDAESIALSIYENNRHKTNAEIQGMIKDVLSRIRFDYDNGYYFMSRLDGSIILLPNMPDREDTSLIDIENSHIMRDMIKIAKTEGEGYYHYTWTKPRDDKKEYKKISFIKYFEPLDMYIGTGLYVNDLEEIIKKEVLDRISEIKYRNDGYIFVTTYDGIALVFAQKEYLGKDVSKVRDINDVNIHDEEIKVIEGNKEGYINYFWSKPNREGTYPKITFVKGIDDWKWIIGTGVYVDEIEKTVKLAEADLRKEIFKNIFKISYILLFIMLLVTFLELYLLKRTEQTIKAEEQLYEILTNLSEDGIFILEPNGRIIEANHKGLKMISCSKHVIKKLNFKELLKDQLFKENIDEIINIETYLVNKSKELIPIDLYIKRIKLNRDYKYIAYVRDLTRRKNYEETLKALAITDELTGVYNRRFIIDQLKTEVERLDREKSILSIVMIDIDRFKNINDTYGHIFGDKVLREFTKILKENLRKTDFIGRYGGEEFLILLPYTDKISAFNTIHRIKNIFTGNRWENKNLRVSFSAGITEINSANRNIKDLLVDVDELLYKAKNNGRDKIEI